MSTAAVDQFLSAVSQNELMLEEVAQVINSNREYDREAVVQVAAKYGYEFTADELGVCVDRCYGEFLSQRQPTELSEDNLQGIAGGGDTAGMFSFWTQSNTTTW